MKHAMTMMVITVLSMKILRFQICAFAGQHNNILIVNDENKRFYNERKKSRELRHNFLRL